MTILPLFASELVLKCLEVSSHRVPRELLSCDQGVFFQWPLDSSILARLIEECNAIALTVVVAWFARGFDAVEGRLETVIRPCHEKIANVAD